MGDLIRFMQYGGGWPHLENIETVNTNEKLRQSLVTRYRTHTIPRKLKGILKYPCLYFTGCMNKKGYGSISADGVKWGAHRASYYLFVGEIPDNKFVLHKCDRPQCVNFHHLYLGTAQDNTNDMMKKKRNKAPGSPGIKNPNAKLTEPLVRLTSCLLGLGLSIKETIKYIHKFEKLSKSTVCRIKNGKSWKHINEKKELGHEVPKLPEGDPGS